VSRRASYSSLLFLFPFSVQVNLLEYFPFCYKARFEALSSSSRPLPSFFLYSAASFSFEFESSFTAAQRTPSFVLSRSHNTYVFFLCVRSPPAEASLHGIVLCRAAGARVVGPPCSVSAHFFCLLSFRHPSLRFSLTLFSLTPSQITPYSLRNDRFIVDLVLS